jgi:hypothetical protein
MTTRNPITGDLIATKGTSDAYRDNYDRIFGKKQLQADIEDAKMTEAETSQNEFEKAE